MIRSREESVTFRQPFRLKSIDRQLPPGTYRLSVDEELIEEVSFPVYRRLATMIFVGDKSSVEMWTIDPRELEAAQKRDDEQQAMPPKAVAEAERFAGEQIDQMTDATATEAEQSRRKERLLKGPPEFRS